MIVSSESCEIWPVTLWYYSILQIWEQLWPTKVFAVFDLDQPFDISSNSMTSPAIGKSLRRGSVVAIFLRHRCCVSWHVFGIQLWSYCRLVSLWASWIGKKTGIHLWMGDGWKVEILDEELQSFTQEASNCNHPSFTCVFVGISVVQMFTSSFISFLILLYMILSNKL